MTLEEFSKVLDEESTDTECDPLGCGAHCHRPWTRRGVDGQVIVLGRTCLLPDGHGGVVPVNRRSQGVTKVSYSPVTGRIHTEGF